ncbi:MULTISPECIES: NAD(P)-dependent oxidoreductase [unclassified Mesorhizobium]|uniref:NAD-dependent epimerase/dehydratase family protein n=1 Tax=unclassified Mesorhizobium TaxID=325217 RepID=UPI000960E316|nr:MULTISPECIES: NAD(P)-dependent oxidoreductase [unclassified Mesorhizobium]MBN9259191.1 NAD(P)-dependent oxidoreductase [Mesorhizobium sp.]OJX71692.1 MAG: dTDP-glucose 4,6-dehydratase [Mesorhizobium sp. 65-26]
MGHRIFLAGGSGAIGRRLIPLLVGAGHRVAATTRQSGKVDELRALGADPVLLDVFDAAGLHDAVASAKPEIVIHQLTDLPPGLDPARMGEAIARNARIREEGTRNLVAAAKSAGARRLVAQSIAWAYAPGPEPHDEADPLDGGAEGNRGITVGGVIALETAVLGTPRLEGIVLRYGNLYGLGTGADAPGGAAPVHVDAAAHAALLAIDHGKPGAFNVAEPNAHVSTRKAVAELGWSAGFRLPA